MVAAAKKTPLEITLAAVVWLTEKPLFMPSRWIIAICTNHHSLNIHNKQQENRNRVKAHEE